LCNRDELDTRLSAEHPKVFARDDVRYLAPIDSHCGGTWIAANEYGLTIALLNGATPSARASRSRGHLVCDLAAQRTVDEVHERLAGNDLDAYAGFQLVVLQPYESARLFEWDGRRLRVTRDAEHRMPLTSSSFDAVGIRKSRLTEFSLRKNAAGGVNVAVLREFHRSHGLRGNHPSAYSICMHRPGARTVSFTRVDVSKSHVQLFYSPAAPCKQVRGEAIRIGRSVNARTAWG
jgi:hypothetical protein